MSSGYSLAFVQGKVTSKPKAKTGYARFEVDVPQWIPGKNGEEGKEKVNKVIVQVVGKASDNASKLSIGDRVTLQGILEKLQYQVEGQNRSRLTVKVFKLRKTNTKDSHNLAVVQGRMGNDPEIRFWPDGGCQLSFSLAVDEWDSIEKKDVTSWIDVRLKGKAAERAAERLVKGTNLILDGRLITDTWEKDGVPSSRTFVEAWDFRFVGGKRKSEDGSDEGGDIDDMPFDDQCADYEKAQSEGRAEPRNNDLDDEIPF